MKTTMGQTIKRLRKECGFTQEELAERLGVTPQAVSKWENDSGMPDISLIVPLASVFDVSTDVLFGIDRRAENEEAIHIISKANDIKEYSDLDTYLNAYDILTEGLRKYPNNLMIMNHCMRLGLALSMPENGWIYAKDRADQIRSETIRQAHFIMANDKNITDILTARQCLIFLYSANKKFDLAMAEAFRFPVRTDFSMYSNMARVNAYMKNHEHEAVCLCSDIDYSLQAFEDNVARLGMAYYNSGNYADAIDVYETFFAVMKEIFKEDCPPPYHDFDSGDCYLLLAKAYLAVGKTDQAMNAVENAVMYYLSLIEKETEDDCIYPFTIKSSLLKKTELRHCIRKDTIKKKLLEKLSDQDIQKLKEKHRFLALVNMVNAV